MIKVLLFDFYGVFLPDAYGAWLKINHKSREGIFAELINRRDIGEIDELEFLAELSDAMGREVHTDEIHPERVELDTELVDLVRELKTKYKICLFSNASTKLREKLKALVIDDLFEEIIVSGETGFAKPSDEAFAIASQRVGVERNEIFFIDDNPKNIEAATRNGMHGFLYTSPTNLREAIQLLY